MVDDYIERRHGRKQVRYDINELKQVLGNTYGVPVYQEQIMAIFQVLADYTLGEADLVRRAMGKKKREELDAHKERFFERAEAKNYDKTKLEKLWSSLEGFADYAFNRSHSVAYGLLAYHTAYLKAHYPAHFWAAVLSNELDNSDKVARYIEKTRQMEIQILPPDINVSFDTFTPQGKTIRFGLAAIKGIGQTAVAAMVAARNSGGPFTSIYDFTERVEARAVNRRVLESLVKAGAFDSLRQQIPVASWRARLFEAIDKAIELATSAQSSNKNQESFFDIFETAADAPVERELPAATPWTDQEVLKAEKETLGFFITGHPLDRYQQVITELAIVSVDQLKQITSATPVKVAGMITSINLRNTKKGDRFALCQLEDQQNAVKVVIWPDTYSRISSQLKTDEPLVVLGRLEVEDEGAYSIIADRIEALDGIRERNARHLELRFNAANMNLAKIEQLHQLLDQNRGECSVVFDLELPQKVVARVTPNHYVRIKPSPELIQEIVKLCQCEVNLQVELVNVSNKSPRARDFGQRELASKK
jgi:DNA polymerase-3 subunit alpha